MPKDNYRFRLGAGGVILVLMFAAGGSAVADPPEGVTLQLNVTCNGESNIRRVVNWPMIVDVALTNTDAMNALLDDLAKRPGTSDPAQTKASSRGITVGSSATSAAALFHFTVTEAGKPARSIRAQALPPVTGSAPNGITVDGHNAFRVSFTVDPGELRGQMGHTLTLEVRLEPKPAEVEQIEAKPLQIQYVREQDLNPVEKVVGHYMAGSYFIAMKQYAKAAPWADRLEKEVPQLAETLRAEMYLGSGDKAKAREACRNALKLYVKASEGEKDAEPPVYLFELLNRIDR